MFLQISLAIAFAGITFVMFSKKSLGYVMREAKYEHRFHKIGFWGLVEDIRMRKYNVLKDIPDKKGQIAVVTGAARGIGYCVVKRLVECGMTVIIGVRNMEAGNKVKKDMESLQVLGKVVVLQLDVSSMDSVKQFVSLIYKDYPKIDLLVNNAGIMFGDYRVTQDGFESQLATNYLGHFLLSHLLLPNLKASGEATNNSARIVNVSSCAHKASEIFFDDINSKVEYIPSAAYAQSKLAQLMAGRYIDRTLHKHGVKVRCLTVHPGVVNTDLFRETPLKKYSEWIMNLLFKTAEEGSITVLHACFSPELEGKIGAYISNCKEVLGSSFSRKEDEQERLFKVTCDMLKIKEFGVSE